MRRAHAHPPVLLGAGRQQALEQANTQTAQGNTHTGQQQDRLGCNGGGGGTDPTNGSGEHTGDGSNKFSHVCNFLSLDFSGSGESGAGRQQTLEQTNTQTTQGNTYASQQQDRLIRNGLSHSTDPANSGGEHSTNRGQQRADSDGSNLSRLATLLSSVISK